MKRLNNLANAAMKAEQNGNPGMKQIWTDKWYALVRQYGKTIEKQKENLK